MKRWAAPRLFPPVPVSVAAAAGAGVLLVLAAAAPASPAAVAFVGGLIAGASLAWSGLFQHRLHGRAPFSAPVPTLIPPQLPPLCHEIVAGVLAVAAHPDDIFRQLMESRLATIASQMRDWSQGRLTFADTEAWRTAYERVLSTPEITEYRSVAWLKSDHYWQDRPGRKGLQLNFELLDRGLRIERILILGWNVWPPELLRPRHAIHRWIEDQHYRGVRLLLLRENDLVGEPDLLRDFGIYGDRAVGELHCDADSRSVSFTLSFDQAAVQLAREQWERLQLYARPYEEFLDARAESA